MFYLMFYCVNMGSILSKKKREMCVPDLQVTDNFSMEECEI